MEACNLTFALCFISNNSWIFINMFLILKCVTGMALRSIWSPSWWQTTLPRRNLNLYVIIPYLPLPCSYLSSLIPLRCNICAKYIEIFQFLDNFMCTSLHNDWIKFCFYWGIAVKNLATVGAKIVIISNSSRRASTTMEKLQGLGFDPSFFTGAITSGELTHQSLQRS